MNVLLSGENKIRAQERKNEFDELNVELSKKKNILSVSHEKAEQHQQEVKKLQIELAKIDKLRDESANLEVQRAKVSTM